MAKGQKKSNREIRKPKQAKAKPEPVARSFIATPGASNSGKRGGK